MVTMGKQQSVPVKCFQGGANSPQLSICTGSDGNAVELLGCCCLHCHHKVGGNLTVSSGGPA